MRRAVLTIVVLLAAYILVYFHRTMTGVMKPEIDYYSSYYGVDSNLLLAIMSSAYFYGYASSQLFMGPLLDYYGVKRVGSVMLLLLGIGTVIMAIPTPITLIAGRLLIGVTASVAFLSYMRTSAIEFELRHQGRLASLALFAGSLSTVLATYPLRLMLNKTGLAATLVLLAVVAFTLAALVYLASRDIGNGRRHGSLIRQFKQLGVVARSPHTWAVSLGALVTYGTVLAYQSAWGQIHLSRIFGFNKDEVGLYLMVIAVAFAAFCIPTGYMSDKFRARKPFLVAATLSSTIAWILTYLSSINHNTTLLLLSFVLMGAAQGLHVVASTMAKEPYNPEIAGTSVAFFNLILFAGIAILQSMLSILSPETSILISLVMAPVGTLVVVLAARETYIQKN